MTRQISVIKIRLPKDFMGAVSFFFMVWNASLQSASHCFRAVAGFDRSLVALAPVRNLLFCAKHLFIAAKIVFVQKMMGKCPSQDRQRGRACIGRGRSVSASAGVAS
jgi:hypothetical protein